MDARLRRIVALSAAAVACACAQGCAGRTDGRPDAAAQTSATQPPAAQSADASHTPEPYAPPLPALKRGGEAFEPVLRMSGGRAFESRALALKAARKDLELSADYPVLVGDERPPARKFNRLMRDFAAEEMRPLLRDRSDPDDKRQRMEGVPMEHHVSHKVVYASDELVSVLFYVKGYTTPSAHGYHYFATFNFDMKAGRDLELKDIFKPGSRYLEALSRACVEDLDRQFPPGYATRGGVRPEAKADNFRSWVVTPGGLVLIFEEYALVAYAEGEPKVLIPFERLKEMMRPEGALAALAARPE
jgi:hypothetical protein